MKTLRFLLALSLMPALFALSGCNDDDGKFDAGTYQYLGDMNASLSPGYSVVDSLMSYSHPSVHCIFYMEDLSLHETLNQGTTRCTPCFLSDKTFKIWRNTTNEGEIRESVLDTYMLLGAYNGMTIMEIPGVGVRNCVRMDIELPVENYDPRHFTMQYADYDFYLQFENPEEEFSYRSPVFRMSICPVTDSRFYALSFTKLE